MIHLHCPLRLDWLSAGVLWVCGATEHWSLFPKTRDINFGLKLASCVAHSNTYFTGKVTVTVEGFQSPADTAIT